MLRKGVSWFYPSLIPHQRCPSLWSGPLFCYLFLAFYSPCFVVFICYILLFADVKFNILLQVAAGESPPGTADEPEAEGERTRNFHLVCRAACWAAFWRTAEVSGVCCVADVGRRGGVGRVVYALEGWANSDDNHFWHLAQAAFIAHQFFDLFWRSLWLFPDFSLMVSSSREWAAVSGLFSGQCFHGLNLWIAVMNFFKVCHVYLEFTQNFLFWMGMIWGCVSMGLFEKWINIASVTDIHQNKKQRYDIKRGFFLAENNLNGICTWIPAFHITTVDGLWEGMPLFYLFLCWEYGELVKW